MYNLKRMDLEELRAFLTVVETGSFLAAEQRLNQSRATLRRRVESLEVRAGVALLNRNRSGVEVTEAGAVLAARGKLMVQEATALVASIRELGQEPGGTLRVVLPPGLPPHLLMPIFAAMRRAYPRMSVHLRLSDDPLRGLLDDVDLAAHFGARSPPGPWVSYEVARVRMWLIAHTDYLRERGTPQTLDDLTRHELYVWAAPGEDPRALPLNQGGTFPVEPRFIATDIHLLRQAVLAGLGIALVPDAMLPDPGVDPDAIVAVLPDVVGRELSVRVVVPSALSDVPKIKAVLKHIRTFTGEL